MSKKRIKSITKARRAMLSRLPSRREMLAGLAALPFLGGAAHAARKKEEEEVDGKSGASVVLRKQTLDQLKGTLPKGQIGSMKMSRMFLGSNLIGGWAHARDLIYVPELFKAYNTEQKIFETLYIAEVAGIDTLNLTTSQLPILNKYKEVTDGKMQSMVQVYPSERDLFTDIDRAIDGGATTIYVQGARGDQFVMNKRVDLLGECVDYIKKQGYPGGIGAHSILVPMACEEADLDTDYYVKTFHHDKYWSAIPEENRTEFCVDRQRFLDHDKFHDNIFDLFPERTAEFMEKVEKPWVAFKVLAGVAIHPRAGFAHAFQNGADFICVGMFDFQIVRDVNIALEVLSKKVADRRRPWYA